LKEIVLKTGLIRVSSDDNLENVISYGSRINKKRGYLFVSKVLGKHIPVKPSIMQKIYKQMASLISNLRGKTLFIGFAETATALGYGVFEEAKIKESFYIHTTRYQTSKEMLLQFYEEHCHAPQHILYMPQDTKMRKILKSIKNIVLIDDEVSTGKTTKNFVKELKKSLPWVENYYLLTILNWVKNEEVDYKMLSLYRGNFEFMPKKYDIDNSIVSESVEKIDLDEIIPYNFGRYGIRKLDIDFKKIIKIDRLIGKKVLVLGTAEFMNAPYLIAKYLENSGIDCYFQATTRSPINLDGAIKSKISFKDNYFEYIDNFLYNVIDKEYDKIIICYETTKLPKYFNLKSILEKSFDVEEIFFNEMQNV